MHLQTRPKTFPLLVYPILFIVIIFSLSHAQQKTFDEKAFFSSLKDSYYILSEQDIENFTALVTSYKMEKLAKNLWQNEEIFPLQLIWFTPDKIFISQRGVPAIPDDSVAIYQQTVGGLKQQLKGLLLDLQRFYLVGIYESIGQDYRIRMQHQIVEVQFGFSSAGDTTNVKYFFGRNGLCLRIEVSYPGQNRQIHIFPEFRLIKTKWLCTGWTVQNYMNNQIESGFQVQITNKLVNNIWVPTDIIIGVQKADMPGNTFFDRLRLRNHLFNQSIQLKN